jgi:hypothetical protein
MYCHKAIYSLTLLRIRHPSHIPIHKKIIANRHEEKGRGRNVLMDNFQALISVLSRKAVNTSDPLPNKDGKISEV